MTDILSCYHPALCISGVSLSTSSQSAATLQPWLRPVDLRPQTNKKINAHLPSESALCTGFNPFERKHVVLLILRLNKGLFCQRSHGPNEVSVLLLRGSDRCSQHPGIRFENQSHITWFPSRWQPVFWSYIRSKLLSGSSLGATGTRATWGAAAHLLMQTAPFTPFHNDASDLSDELIYCFLYLRLKRNTILNLLYEILDLICK